VGQFFLAFFQNWHVAGVAIGTALVAEMALSWLTGHRRPSFISAYITGVSIGILLDSPVLWPYALGSFLAIGSKYVVHYQGRHVFNPSNFGVVALLALAPKVVAVNGSQWTNVIWVMAAIAFLGFLVMRRIGRLDVVIAFIGSFAALSLIRAKLTSVSLGFAVGPLLGAALQLFTFFMITDPRTSPGTRSGRVLYGTTIAVVDALLRTARVSYSPFLALFGVSAAQVALWIARDFWGVARRRLTRSPLAEERR